MTTINMIAKEINIETNKQSKKLNKIDKKVNNARDNIEYGVEQLTNAETKASKPSKWLYFAFGMLCLLFVMLVVAIFI
jgi:t-SNARE complex subunit (syntaxin)